MDMMQSMDNSIPANDADSRPDTNTNGEAMDMKKAGSTSR
jgi:hypothetical protein